MRDKAWKVTYICYGEAKSSAIEDFLEESLFLLARDKELPKEICRAPEHDICYDDDVDDDDVDCDDDMD